MLFSSLLFLWLFLPLVAGVYYLLPKAWRRAKNGLLLVASLFFYGWGEPVSVSYTHLTLPTNSLV